MGNSAFTNAFSDKAQRVADSTECVAGEHFAMLGSGRRDLWRGIDFRDLCAQKYRER